MSWEELLNERERYWKNLFAEREDYWNSLFLERERYCAGGNCQADSFRFRRQPSATQIGHQQTCTEICSQ